MRKSTLFLFLIVALFSASKIQAGTTTTIPEYFVNQDFNGAIAHPTGWSTAFDPNYSLFGSGGYNYTTPVNQMNLVNGGSGNRGIKVSFPTSGTEPTVYLDFDWIITGAAVAQKNALGLFLEDNSTLGFSGNDIIILYCSGTDGMIHCQNIDNSSPTFQNVTASGSFLKSGADAATCNTNNASTITTCSWTAGSTIHISATLDFVTKKVTYLKLSNAASTPTSYENTTGLNFISALATNLSKICLTNTRSSASGSGVNSALNVGIDNFKTYKLKEVSTDKVTINYKDNVGNSIKTSREQLNLEIGATYTVTTDDKATFSDASYYYAYDATSTDNVVVATGGSVINLIFKKTALIAGTYTWTGLTNSIWNNADNNFTTDGTNSLGYQNSNPIAFPTTATNKTVNLTADLALGSNDITLSGDAYALSGTGSLAGTGKLLLNLNVGETATIGVKNNFTGGLFVNGGTGIITNDLGSATYSIADGAKIKLQTGANFTKAIAGTGAITIEASSNVYYTNAVTGASTVNLILDNAGSGTSATWTDYFSGTFPSGAQINVTTGLAAAGYGVGDALLTNNKVSLGDGVRLLRWYNQASSTGGTSTILVGELSGNATSTIEGGMVDAANRILAYEIGALNTDATFTGVIKNYGAVTQAPLNISKKGTGIWTLTGASTYSPGIFNVDAGKVVMNGSLAGTAVPVTVAAGATLSGTGSIAGATTVNGTLEGRLNFGSTLTLAGATNLVINGFNAGEFDVVNVTGALTLGGTLKITVNGANPARGTAIKIFKAASYSGNFTQPIEAPSNYLFDNLTGMLLYDGATALDETGTTKSGIYPTLTTGEIFISVANATSAEIVNLTGQLVKHVTLTNDKTTIHLNGLSTGTYFVKVRTLDGSVKVQKVIYQQ